MRRSTSAAIVFIILGLAMLSLWFRQRQIGLLAGLLFIGMGVVAALRRQP